MKPPRSILDPAFRYTPADKTDIRRLFDRVRRELEAQRPVAENVKPIRKPRREIAVAGEAS